MRTTNRALRQARRLVPAAALTTALLAGGAVTATPASAESGPLSLTVHAPNEIGFAGGPVEFTETIGNDRDRTLAVTLDLSIDSAIGTPPHALSLDYVNAQGVWESVPLTVRTETDRTVSSGATGAVLVPAGGKDVRLRIGAPMGEPHNGTSNGGVGPTVSLRSTAKGPKDVPAESLPDTHRIVVGSISNAVVGAPGTAVAGGAPIEFEVQLANPTPSAYTNLGNVLLADRRAKVEVRGADGTWAALTGVVGIPDDPAGFYVEGRDSSAAPGSHGVKQVRVSFPADMPLGRTELNPCVFVNEGMPMRGTTMCSAGASVQVVAPSAPAPTTTPADQGDAPAPTTGGDPAPARPAAEGAQAAQAAQAAQVAPVAPVVEGAPVAAPAAAPEGGQPLIAADGGVTPWSEHPAEAKEQTLAATGADTGWDRPAAGVGALLLGAGAGVLVLVRRRRAVR